MGYERKIKYLQLVENGIYIQNAGFLKLELRGRKVSIFIHIEKLKDMTSRPVKVMLIAGEKTGVLGEIMIEGGRGEAVFEELQYENIVNNVSYEELEEIHLKPDDGRSITCVIKEKKTEAVMPVDIGSGAAAKIEEEKNFTEILTASADREESDTEVAASTILPMQNAIVLKPMFDDKVYEENAGNLQRESTLKRTDEVGIKKEERHMESTKWKQLWDIYPHIRPFNDEREYLQLRPEDFVIFTKEFFSLANNSFLLHGFYNYEHLVLTKEKRQDKERYYVGVPGNFYVKEKQVAVLFGFQSFEGKREPAQNGDFGYYMIPVEI